MFWNLSFKNLKDIKLSTKFLKIYIFVFLQLIKLIIIPNRKNIKIK
jgi:hypothetical protein